ncbi:MarR family transcriptional regulator [Clostridium sp. 'deep sea']|uniref:MarR family winged helix-turn-helix transcriptional regulator n=1 Tax=Clostridium sp. 'deep sea' TaxID=2779445 RepID=UPI0018966D18|nr:MarR family transcriptional regulator [Clostridium sp. 'deep sea']QOR35994.1 MarR family transcriptional regulator [Clostridium sp. 'deep sea']
MSKLDSSSRIIQLLDEIHHEMYHKKKYKDVATQFNMSKEQVWILWKLRRAKKRHKKEYSVGQLAKMCNVAQNTMSERITRLAERGFVTRIQNPNDRRKYIVELNKSGEDLLNYIDEEHKRLFALEIEESLSTEKREMLTNLLSELVSNIREE